VFPSDCLLFGGDFANNNLKNDMTPITGIGWKSAVRVRILHSTVRVRLLAKKGIKKIYDEKVDGIPINQE